MGAWVQKYWPQITFAIMLAGGLIMSGRKLQEYMDRVSAMCNRQEQLISLFVKYRYEETEALYYPGAKECP